MGTGREEDGNLMCSFHGLDYTCIADAAAPLLLQDLHAVGWEFTLPDFKYKRLLRLLCKAL